MSNQYNSDAITIMAGVIVNNPGLKTFIVYGWRLSAMTLSSMKIITLAIDDHIFGLCEEGYDYGLGIPSPEGALPFVYPVPTAFLDGNEHSLTASVTIDGSLLRSTVSIRFPHHDQPLHKKNTISVCAIVKNESKYLVEWYAHYRTLGVDHFYIYNNESVDDTNNIIDTLANDGCITSFYWESKELLSPQVAAYKHALDFSRSETEWIFFVDIDEYLVLKKHSCIKEFLLWHRGANAIAINWSLFGSSGLKVWDNRPVIERFQRRAAQEIPDNLHVKTIARTSAIRSVDVHHVELSHGLYLMSSGQRIDTRNFNGVSNIVDWSVARLNHYFCKSYQEWSIKRDRGRADYPQDSKYKFRTDDDFTRLDFNNEEDHELFLRNNIVYSEINRLITEYPSLSSCCPYIK